MTSPPTNWKAICDELVDEWDAASGDRDLLSFADAIDRIRTLLAQPQPEGLTDEELDKVLFQAVNAYMETRGPFDGPVDQLRLDRAKARAAIAADRARWRRPLPTQPTTTP